MMTLPRCLVLVACIVFGVQRGACEEGKPTASEFVIPLSKSAEFATALLRQVEKVMAPFASHQQHEAAASSFVTGEGCYVLHGDLFGGQRFALMELKVKPPFDKVATREKVVGLAWLNAGRWELRTVIDVAPVWRPKGWKESEGDYLHIVPAERPFELADLSADGVPEIILAADVDKYFQQHFLFHWNAEAKSLTFVAASMRKPVRSGSYVVLYSNSGRRAIWEEWEFCQWEGDMLVGRALWHEEAPYDAREEPFMAATQVNSDGTGVVFEVKNAESNSAAESVYQITREKKPFARLTFKWIRTFEAVTADGYYPFGEQSAYLFEKLTGLPRNIYQGNTGERRLKSLETSVKIQVEGEHDAVQMLLPR